ncbi:MAG: hypothetical protein FGF52_00285 [Candidatus Brockarchaeota archaeon]|nr:hypothetical protein [Candidatus Brockarchaeota archaeon]
MIVSDDQVVLVTSVPGYPVQRKKAGNVKTIIQIIVEEGQDRADIMA